jgi:tetratricopeptide (TPR) repeat protein
MKTVKKIRRAILSSSRKARLRRASAAYRSWTGSRRRVASSGRNGASGRAAERLQPDPRFLAAIKNFELGSRAFQKQNYVRAREIFEKLAQGEIKEVAERARVRLHLCQQKLSRSRPAPKSAEDYYTLGVGALNARNLDEAVECLGKAHKLNSKQEHVRYALAAVQALRGNTGEALEHLKAAIALRPANRIQARHDEDFRALASDARFRNLVYPQVP